MDESPGIPGRLSRFSGVIHSSIYALVSLSVSGRPPVSHPAFHTAPALTRHHRRSIPVIAATLEAGSNPPPRERKRPKNIYRDQPLYINKNPYATP